MKLAPTAALLCLLSALPASAKDLYRCTTPAGVQYQDTPCAVGAGGKVAIQDDRPNIADEIAAQRKLGEMKADAKASDARMAADAKARRAAREAAARDEAYAQRMAEIYATPVPEPSVVYVPYLVPYPVPTQHHRPPPALPTPPEKRK